MELSEDFKEFNSNLRLQPLFNRRFQKVQKYQRQN